MASGTPIGIPLVRTTMPRLADGSMRTWVEAPWKNAPEWLQRTRPAASSLMSHPSP